MSFLNKEYIQTKEKDLNMFQTDFSNAINFEYCIKNIFNHEFKLSFENILIFKKENFLNSVKQKVFSILTIKYSNKLFENQNLMKIISKYIEKLNIKYDNYYNSLSEQFSIFQIEKEKLKKNKYINLNKYYVSLYRKHCSNSPNYALHLCNYKSKTKNTGKLIKIKNNNKNDKEEYLICENCKKAYFLEYFKCYCQFCQEVYFSNQLNKFEKKDLLPAALKHYHCEVIVNDLLNCPLCKKVLYLNLNNNKLQCINERCKNNIIFERTEWKCKNCSKLFTSDFKVYNPLEIKLLTDEINYCLYLKIKAKPNKIPCCTDINLNETDFFHSKKCAGLIYFGEFNQKKFIVCEKCKAINFHEKFIWTCPKCNCRFREIKDKDKDKEKIKDKENNEQIITSIIKNDKNNFKKNLETSKCALNKKVNNSFYDIIVEKRKRIFSQEYDYDNESNSRDKKSNFYDENCDINIIKTEIDFYKKKNIICNTGLLRQNNFVYNKSRNKNKIPILNMKNLSNNIIYEKEIKNKINLTSRDNSLNEEKHKYKKRAISNLTSANFYLKRNNKETLFKDNNITNNLQKRLSTSSQNRKVLGSRRSNGFFGQKKDKKYFIPYSKYMKRDISKNNRSFFENNSINGQTEKKNYTPNLYKYRKNEIKSNNNNDTIENISKNSIENDRNKNSMIKNRSPFLLRRMLNFSLTKPSIEEYKKNKNKNESNNIINDNKLQNISDLKKIGFKKRNYHFYNLISCNNESKNYRHIRDNSINSNNSIRNCFCSEKKRNKNENKNEKQNQKERYNKISQSNSKYGKRIISSKNEKSKSENKENKEKETKEKNILKNNNTKYKYRSRIKKEDNSLKPKDIIESSMVDQSIDIPIENEAIKKDKNLYQHIQRRLKKVLSKGKLPQFIVENYTVTRQLGEGSFGAIFEVYNNDTKIKYAMKKIIANNINSLEFYQKEFEIVHENRHPNILDIHGVCMRCLDTTTYVLYVLMDIAERDWEVEINERAKIKKYYSEKELISMLKQLVNALCYLQKEKNVAHRDIKPENILLFKNNVCKIADFGEAKKSKDNKFKTLRGTEFYMSPILYNNLKEKRDYVRHNPYKSDVFSLGYCLVCATALDFDIIEKIREKNVPEIKKVFNQYFQKFYSKKFVELIFKMINIDEEKRIDFIQLKEILYKDF